MSARDPANDIGWQLSDEEREAIADKAKREGRTFEAAEDDERTDHGT